jgi:hypothetical protein
LDATKKKKDDPSYAARDTKRIDIFERLDDDTVCVYDIKTGDKTWRSRDMNEVAAAVARRYPTAKRFILIETKLPEFRGPKPRATPSP